MERWWWEKENIGLKGMRSETRGADMTLEEEAELETEKRRGGRGR